MESGGQGGKRFLVLGSWFKTVLRVESLVLFANIRVIRGQCSLVPGSWL